MLFADKLLGSGMIVDLVKQAGTTAWDKEVLKMSANTPVSPWTNSLKTRPGTLSGPDGFRGLIIQNVLLTSIADVMKGDSPGAVCELVAMRRVG